MRMEKIDRWMGGWVELDVKGKGDESYWGGRCFLPQAPRSYPIPMAHRVTPGHPEVTPGTKSYWHTSTTPPLVWQAKYVKCFRAIMNHVESGQTPLAHTH